MLSVLQLQCLHGGVSGLTKREILWHWGVAVIALPYGILAGTCECMYIGPGLDKHPTCYIIAPQGFTTRLVGVDWLVTFLHCPKRCPSIAPSCHRCRWPDQNRQLLRDLPGFALLTPPPPPQSHCGFPQCKKKKKKKRVSGLCYRIRPTLYPQPSSHGMNINENICSLPKKKKLEFCINWKPDADECL